MSRHYYPPERTKFQIEIEWAERDIVSAAQKLAAHDESLVSARSRSGAAYSDRVDELSKAVARRDKAFTRMQKAARKCTADHAHAAYDGEDWCPVCGGMTRYSRFDK